MELSAQVFLFYWEKTWTPANPYVSVLSRLRIWQANSSNICWGKRIWFFIPLVSRHVGCCLDCWWYPIKHCVCLHFSGRLPRVPCPHLSLCSVSQTQRDTFETDKDVTGSGRLSIGVLEGPTVIPNWPSGRLNSMLSPTSQTCHTVRDLCVKAPIQP